MNLPSYFKDFLSEIEPSASYKEDQQRGHATLRKRLAEDPDFSKIHVATFLQGSYKRQTAIHPGKDVDIVVVTNLDPDVTKSTDATARLKRCLERYYDNVTPQNRALCVTLTYVTMDVVIATSRELLQENALKSLFEASSIDLAERWKTQLLQIPDRELKKWVDTHPKAQLEWTTARNKESGGFFVPLVKMFKWWRKEAYRSPAYPKGYSLERIAGDAFDPTARDHAEGFVRLLRNVVARYEPYSQLNLVPTLRDPGVPGHNVLGRVAASDFKAFVARAKCDLEVAEDAIASTDKAKSVDLWQRLFGAAFPSAPTVEKAAAFPNAAVRPPNRPAGFA